MSPPISSSSYLRQLRLSCAFSVHSPSEAQRLLAKTNYDHGRALVEGHEDFFYSTLFVPGELLAAFGLVPTPYEPIVGLMASAPDVEEKLRDRADGAAFPCEICSYQRLFRGLLQQQDVPLPLGFIASTFVCEDVRGMCEYLARKHGRRSFVIDVPCRDDDEAVRYVGGQLEDLARFIAETSGRQLTRDGLTAALRCSNEALRLKREIDALRTAHPGVAEGGIGFQLFTLYARFGMQSTVDIHRAVHGELSAKAAAPSRKAPSAKILWVDIMPWYSNGMIAYLERTCGAAVVYEELNAFDWPLLDEDHPWESLARKLLSDHRLGPARKRVARIRELAQVHQIDAVVCYSHAQCRVTPTTIDFIGEALREMEIPWIELHGDVIDRQASGEVQNRLKLEALMEMVR